MNLGRVIIQNIKDYLFPVFCLECDLEGEWWCEKCIRKNKVVGVYYCPVCHINNDNGHPCDNCKATTSLDGVVAFFDYDDQKVVGQLIRQYKYNFAFDIAVVWENIIELYLIEIIEKLDLKGESVAIIPIPLHIVRERGRGFNQADLVAKKIYKKLTISRLVTFDSSSLQRKKYTKQQAKLNRADRLVNLRDAFVWNNKIIPAKNIILVDDVYTSGATMQECARVLKSNGAKKVYGFTLARD